MNQLKQQELRYVLNSDSFARKDTTKIIPAVLIIALASLVLLLAR